ncbi:hypothetical protein GIB67_033416 [Kingdonia uniflora]|uniref:Cellulose synthase-like protein G3 n=1 Tax=Kingdonia uniflora TaxID=39325 RepID=A0A7J7LU11_9MAGN|nr:hypothetical protein GIB67_033416 [Kingdonia uniflora]
MVKVGETNMSKNNPYPFPLNTKELQKGVYIVRVQILVCACAIIALLYHHILHLLFHPMSLPSFILSLTLFISHVTLTFLWVTTQTFRWCPIKRKVYLENLSLVTNGEDGLPGLDVFICTADPYKEPPINTANTALSVLAFDYPTRKLSVYVSDDGGSKFTLFALFEASKFAKHWLPFCKEYGIRTRCPEAFFKDENEYSCSKEEWEHMKILHEKMKSRVETVMRKGYVDNDMIENKEEGQAFDKWTDGFSHKDHHTIIQVLLQSDENVDVSGQFLPNLIYVSREKRNTFHHNFKAGALNVLLRVSTLMTNAPIVLTLDCDMHSNDPQTPQRALCHLLEPIEGPKIAFVQFPQRYKGINESDIYNSELKRPFRIYAAGLDGLGVVNYCGTGSFLRRKALYSGLSEPDANGLLATNHIPLNSRFALEAAHEVASCMYEQGTNWGHTMGLRYGSLVEDFFTGYRLQCEGWSSVLCDPLTPAFLGDIPITLNDSLVQNRRWAVGLFEVGCSKYCPLIFGTKKRSLLMGLGYSFFAFWALWSIPTLIYGFVPQLGLLYDICLFPKVHDGWFYLYCYLFLASYIQDYIEINLYGRTTLKKWWNEQRIWIIRSASSSFFALLDFSCKQIGLQVLEFNLTSKLNDSEQQKRYDQEMFDFGVETPLFVLLSMIAILNLVSFTWGFMKVMRDGNIAEMFTQLFICGFVVVNALPIYEAMVLRRDGGRMPIRVTLVSIFLTWVLYYATGFALKG